ncbi:MAG: hypothetical protein AAGA61_11020 [Pseudomonadota bacterium]
MTFFRRLVLGILIVCSPMAVADTDSMTGLVIAPGWELVRAQCGGCHSHKLVTSQRADRQTWLDMIRWMQGSQNLWTFDPQTEAAILDYLATNYPPQPNRRRAPIPASLMPPDPPATE